MGLEQWLGCRTGGVVVGENEVENWLMLRPDKIALKKLVKLVALFALFLVLQGRHNSPSFEKIIYTFNN